MLPINKVLQRLVYHMTFYYHVYHLGSLLKKSKVLNTCTMVFVTSNPKNLDPTAQFSNERLPKEHALPLFTTSLAIDDPKPINSCPSNQSRSPYETNIEIQ